MGDNHIEHIKENLFLQLVAEEEFIDIQSIRRIHTIADFKDGRCHTAKNMGKPLGAESCSQSTGSNKTGTAVLQ